MVVASVKHTFLTERLRYNPVLQTLNATLMGELERSIQVVRYRTGRKLYREGGVPEYVFALIEGGVRVYHEDRTPKNGAAVVELVKAPSLVGAIEPVARVPRLGTAITIVETEVAKIPVNLFLAIMAKDSRFAFELARDLALRLFVSNERARELAFCSAETRLASLTSEFADLFGVQEDDGSVRIEARMSQLSFARSLAVSRATINQIMRKWIDNGLLTRKLGRYIVRDLRALKRLSDPTLLPAFQ